MRDRYNIQTNVPPFLNILKWPHYRSQFQEGTICILYSRYLVFYISSERHVQRTTWLVMHGKRELYNNSNFCPFELLTLSFQSVVCMFVCLLRSANQKTDLVLHSMKDLHRLMVLGPFFVSPFNTEPQDARGKDSLLNKIK